MSEIKSAVCIVNGKKILIREVSKIILAVRTSQRQQVQAGIDINEQNIRAIQKTIRREV